MRKTLLVFLILSALGFAGILLIFQTDTQITPDKVAINDAVMTAIQSGNQTEATTLLTELWMRSYQAMNSARKNRDTTLLVLLCIFIFAYTAVAAWLYLYCDRSVLKPFRKLERFAQNVAVGNLDIPLEMDRHGRFGAFTEGFDLMREELKKARENERCASQSKKELVASLSHDIKTPVASIRAVTELMLVKSSDSAAQLELIMSKADQIDLLITNLFHATLEELEQLKVCTMEFPSTELAAMLQSADYDGKIHMGLIPECVITADKARLQQVLDNIVSNSYKYANTEIEATFAFDGSCFAIEINDTGPGVAPEELPLIFEKFYRGGNAAGKSGSGLGLYISKYLLYKMNGDIQVYQKQNGFTVKILLAM